MKSWPNICLPIYSSFRDKNTKNKNTKSLNIFKHTILYITYADGTTVFLKYKESLVEVIKVFDIFSSFSSLKPNKFKCEVTGIDVQKGTKLALCGMKSVDLRLNTVKILGIHFFFNKKIENDKSFSKPITSIETVLELWGIRNLILEGKITVFKASAMSKIV